MEIPKNCRECKHSSNCRGPYYGGSFCAFKEQIEKQRIAKILKN